MSWLERQSFLGAKSDDVLANTTIGIVGLGGGGSHVAQQLAHVGIGRFVLIDPDTIEDTNLNRLVGGTLADVKRSTAKVEIAKRLIKGVRPDAEVEAVKAEWQTANDKLKRCDVILGGIDSVRAKNELDAFCRRFLIPYIDQGMDVHGDAGRHLIAGQVILSCPGRACLQCFGLVTEAALTEEGRNYGAAGGKPQVVWPNGVLGATAVGLVMQLVTPWFETPADSAYLEYDGNLGTMTPSYRMKLMADKSCTHYPPAERGDPTFDVRELGRRKPKPQKVEETRVEGGLKGMLRALRRFIAG